jgi:hypothetical protein
MLMRRVERRDEAEDQPWYQFVAIDKWTGRILTTQRAPYLLAMDYRIVGDPAEKLVSVLIKDMNLTLRFCEDPGPPAPVAWLTNDNSIAVQRIVSSTEEEERRRIADENLQLKQLLLEQAKLLEQKRTEMKLQLEQQKQSAPEESGAPRKSKLPSP